MGDAPDTQDEPPVVIRDKRKFDSDFNLRAEGAEPAGRPAPSSDAAELGADEEPVPVASDEAVQLAERTADLQRLTAEYANYRKRVERDRAVAGEVAIARVLDRLLPVLDDLERAEAHGDLTGAFKAVADKITDGLGSFGLAAFGEAGDPFDPAIHEAVTHDESADVSVPTATLVMRKGYKLNERLLRAAMVGVSDPAGPSDPGPSETVPAEPTD